MARRGRQLHGHRELERLSVRRVRSERFECHRVMKREHPLITAVRPVIDAVGATIVEPDASDAADVPLVWDGITVGAVRLPPIHGALERLIDTVETELGGAISELSREDKQRAIRILDERGAFILRRAVEDVADAMGVSRITVYNYLNAIHR